MLQENQEKDFRSGFIAIIGKPNVGKSTLLNAIIGEKIAIISDKPQTTRNQIRGIKNFTNSQMVFLDTPGIHHSHSKLNQFMVETAFHALEEVDIILYIVDQEETPEEKRILEKLKEHDGRKILVINKVDLTPKPALLPIIDRYYKMQLFEEIIPISALKQDGIETLLQSLLKLLPVGPKYFPDDMLTDQMERFLVGEVIREKVFHFTDKEIPYSSAVEIEKFIEDEDSLKIWAAIYIEKNSQKPIVLGKNGAKIKKIRLAAQRDLKRILGIKTELELWVKYRKNWTKDDSVLRQLGYALDQIDK